ncbi:MAG: type I glutamate--ammonia ligase [Actinobacteria bacterium]|nr:type I glutamate--ammonia ligase [Actinomycetota bacterium]
MQDQLTALLDSIEDHHVQLVQLWFTDVLGVLKSISITPAELEHSLIEGMTFDGSAIDGFSRVQESDILAKPDPKTFQLLPFDDDGLVVGRVICDLYNLDGSPFEGCPRQVLRKALSKAHAMGLSFFAAPEIEYFYLDSKATSNGLRFLDEGAYFEQTVSDLASNLRKRSVMAIEGMGIPVEHSQHEDAPGQHEIDLRYGEALWMADAVMTARHLIKEVAHHQGVLATFMPKPVPEAQGSGMHTHFSLFEGNDNVFYDGSDTYGLSKLAKSFIAGLLMHAKEITAVTNQWVNSYKRLVVGYEAPVYVSWARNNRSALVRVPMHRRHHPSSCRIEYRAPDPACNPYLAFALVLAAGLDGVNNNYPLPEEASANLWTLTPHELASEGITSLPDSLYEAVGMMEQSELVAETLGEHVFEWFIRNKKEEWLAYKRQVSQFEIDRYLHRL